MVSFTIISALFSVFATSAIADPVIKNTIYAITTAETPFGQLGLTPVGLQRAQECIPSVFGDLDIGKIISCPPNKDGSGTCFETVNTITPLANALGLPIDTKCGADENTDDDCVTKQITKFAKNSTQAILIAWDLHEIGTMLDNINADAPDDSGDGGNNNDEDDPSAHHDLVYTVKKNVIVSMTSMNCTGLDGPAPGTVRRSEANVRRPAKRHPKPSSKSKKTTQSRVD